MKALKSILVATSLALGMLIPPVAFAQESAPIRVYGPGGPAPAMKEAAKAFEKKTGTTVLVTAGPTPEWIARAKADADVIYSGPETMMTDFAQAMEGRFDQAKAEPLLRPLAILVRPGNPGKITGLADLFKPGQRVLVVNGAGQNGAWEDAAGRKGEIASVRALRANIVKYAGNSALARQEWRPILRSMPGSSGTYGKLPTRRWPTWCQLKASMRFIATPALSRPEKARPIPLRWNLSHS